MKRYRSIFYPVSTSRIGRIESWLSDMALQGLSLYKLKTYRAVFSHAESRQMEYRLEYIETKDQQEVIKLYTECGWKFVCSLKYILVFCAPSEENLQEIHTDPIEQAFLQKKCLEKELFMWMILFVLTMFNLVFGIFLILLPSILEGVFTPWLDMYDGFGIQLFSVMTWLILAITFGWKFLARKKMIRDLKKARPINHHEPWKKTFEYRSIGIKMGFLVLVLVCYGYSFFVIGKNLGETILSENRIYFKDELEEQSIADILPILKELEEDGVSVYSERNRYTTELKNFGKPVKGYQIFTYPDQIWADSGEVYSPSLEIQVEQCYFKWLSKQLFDDMVKRGLTEKEGFQQVPVTNSFFDEAEVYQSAMEFLVFLRVDKMVIALDYCGQLDAKILLKELEGFYLLEK